MPRGKNAHAGRAVRRNLMAGPQRAHDPAPGNVAVRIPLDLSPDLDWLALEDGSPHLYEDLGRFVRSCYDAERRRQALTLDVAAGLLTAEDAAELYHLGDLADGEVDGPLATYRKGMCSSCSHAMAMHGGDGSGACSADGCSCKTYAEEDYQAHAVASFRTVPARLEQFTLTEELADVPVGAKIRWEAVFAPEGKLTSDGRAFAPGAISWRELPLTLMAMLETQEGHDGARVCGKIEQIWRDEEAGLIRASGYFDDGHFGAEVARLVDDRTLRGLSVDLAIFESEVGPSTDYFDDAGNWIAEAAEAAEEDVADIGWGEGIFLIRRAEIGMATVCPFPAFAEAHIEVGQSLVASGEGAGGTILTFTFDAGARVTVEKPAAALVASAAAPVFGSGLTASAAGLVPAAPPREWFDDPGLDALTPLVVTDDGRVYGHAWPWAIDGAPACHTAFPAECVTAPHSDTGYAYFHLGEVSCDDGSRVPVGKITLDTGHAAQSLSRGQAVRHYDDTGTVVAYVRVGEDEFGGWFSGCIAPDVDADVVTKLRGSTPSGDWREVQGNLELVALLEVNVPGFPVPRTASAFFAGTQIHSLVAAGARALALVAAGEPPPAGPTLPADDLARLEAIRDLIDGAYTLGS